MEKEIVNLADKHIQQAICDALNCLKHTSPTILQNRPLRPAVPLRRRSSSNNRNNRKVPFHKTIPRCSLPATNIDLQTRCGTVQSIKKNRTFDVQYSFSLNKPWLTKTNKRRENYANQVAEQSIRDALLQIGDQNVQTQAINSYADGLIHSTIDQAIGNIPSSDIKHLSNRLAEDIITDVLLTISDNEKYSRKIKKKSEPSVSNNTSSNERSIDSLVNNITQQIYTNSLDELRRTFTKDNNSDL